MGGQHSVKKEHIYDEIDEKEDGSGTFDRNESVITLDIKTNGGNGVSWELEDSWDGLEATSKNKFDAKHKTKENKRNKIQSGIRFENRSPLYENILCDEDSNSDIKRMPQSKYNRLQSMDVKKLDNSNEHDEF